MREGDHPLAIDGKRREIRAFDEAIIGRPRWGGGGVK